MTSDLTITDSTVVAIQGNAVKSESLGATNDGYVLTWVNGDSKWEAKPIPASGGMTSQYFTSSGTWTAPAGVTAVILIGCGGGGGGGGGGGANNYGGGGGGGALQQTAFVSVTPGNSYTVTIGSGGSGGTGATGGNGNNGGNGTSGSDTTFGSLFAARGASYGAGPANIAGSNYPGLGGTNFAGGTAYPDFSTSAPVSAAQGGVGGDAAQSSGYSGNKNYVGTYSGGSGGSANSCFGGGGGGAGPQGVGGNGGNGAPSGTGSNGSAGGANTGAGGGGGGGSLSGNDGNGGAGGSGYLYVIWS